ncbi:response regulator, partial [Escherichia coli]|nr:response regulator [Escherichia coli]
IEGFTVVAVAHSGHEALVKVNEYQVDLVLLDVFMPGQNGLKVLQEIRTKQEEIDVIFITAASDAQTIQQALRYGAIDYLIKPFTFERF